MLSLVQSARTPSRTPANPTAWTAFFFFELLLLAVPLTLPIAVVRLLVGYKIVAVPSSLWEQLVVISGHRPHGVQHMDPGGACHECATCCCVDSLDTRSKTHTHQQSVLIPEYA